MPSSVREGSVFSITGIRRAAPRHLPYRQDEFTQGKRTGVTVGYVERNSDGVEDPTAFFNQADKHLDALKPPSKPRPKKVSRTSYMFNDDIPSSPSRHSYGPIGPPSARRSTASASAVRPNRTATSLNSNNNTAGRRATKIPQPSPLKRSVGLADEEEEEGDVPMPASSLSRRGQSHQSTTRRPAQHSLGDLREEDEDEDDEDTQFGRSRDGGASARLGRPSTLPANTSTRIRPSYAPATPEPEVPSRRSFGRADQSLSALRSRQDEDDDDGAEPEASVRMSFAEMSEGDDDMGLDGPDPFPEEFHKDYPEEFREPSVKISAKAKGKQRVVDPEPEPEPMPEPEDEDEPEPEPEDEPMDDERLPTPEPYMPIDEPDEVEEEPEEPQYQGQMDIDEPMDEEDSRPIPSPEKIGPPKGRGKGKKGKRKEADKDDENKPMVPKVKKQRTRPPQDKNKTEPLRHLSVEINQDYDSEEESVDDNGLRRGRRTRYPPLEWWRLEKVEYGRGKELAEIKRIVRMPKEKPRSLGNKKRGVGTRARSVRAGSRAATAAMNEEELEEAERRVWNPEEGWDEKTRPDGVIVDYVSKEEVSRRVAWTAAMVHTKPAENNDFEFQKVFGDGDFIAAGQLLIPPGGKKPSKNTKDNTYVFFVIEGSVKFWIHKSPFVMCQGGMVLVPRGNLYLIENISDRDAKLFFAQARKIPVHEEEPPTVVQRRSRTSGASDASSVGPGSGRRSVSGRE